MMIDFFFYINCSNNREFYYKYIFKRILIESLIRYSEMFLYESKILMRMRECFERGIYFVFLGVKDDF